jgi:hypothetical protein
MQQQQQQLIRQLLQQQQQQQQQQPGNTNDNNNNNNNNNDWDAVSVTWTIPKFEKRLTCERHFYESSTFSIGQAGAISFYLTVCVLEVGDTVPESKRPIAIFLKVANQKRKHHPSTTDTITSTLTGGTCIFPLRLDGSSITLVGNHGPHSHTHGHSYHPGDKTVQVGQTVMEDASQGKGVRQFTTLGNLRDLFLQSDDSVIVRATVRVPRIPTYILYTQ